MKKIIFLINSLGCGGAERVISNISQKLVEDYDITVVTLINDGFNNFENNKVKIKSIINSKNEFDMIIQFPKILRILKKIIKKEKPFKIISFLEISNFANILVNKNAIISFRTNMNLFKENNIKNIIYKTLIKHLYPKAKQIIVNSEENKELFQNFLKVKSHKIKCIYNPLSLDAKVKTKDMTKSRSKNNTNSKSKKFITVSRLEALKNVDLMIKSFLKTNKDDVLEIIGDGPEFNKLKDLVNEKKAEKRIFLLGRQKNIAEYLSKADYFLYTSRTEGFPNTLMEATLAKLPIITSDFKTGAREVIDPKLDLNGEISYPKFGPNGVLIDLNNYESELSYVMKNINKLTQKQKGIERFDINNVVKEWKRVIEND